jgi:hypothetical protein
MTNSDTNHGPGVRLTMLNLALAGAATALAVLAIVTDDTSRHSSEPVVHADEGASTRSVGAAADPNVLVADASTRNEPAPHQRTPTYGRPWPPVSAATSANPYQAHIAYVGTPADDCRITAQGIRC